MKRIVLLLAFFIFANYSFSQNITGSIINFSKEKIVGAYVDLNPTEIHTYFDNFGKFILEDLKESLPSPTLI